MQNGAERMEWPLEILENGAERMVLEQPFLEEWVKNRERLLYKQVLGASVQPSSVDFWMRIQL
jgi:hypothetical protein